MAFIKIPNVEKYSNRKVDREWSIFKSYILEAKKLEEEIGRAHYMGMLEWAENEIKLACERERGGSDNGEWNYGCACYDSALKAFKSLLEDGHSGMSISITKDILNRLIDGKCLTAVSEQDEWRLSWENDEEAHYQSKRMSSLFKTVNKKTGDIEYDDVDRVCAFDENLPKAYYHCKIARDVVNEFFPITLPYYPENGVYRVAMTNYLTDRKNGDFDTECIDYIKTPDGDMIHIGRYYAQAGDKMMPISLNEYEERVLKHYDRLEKEALSKKGCGKESE